MYYDYFGLKQPPFRITPDTTLFFPGGNRGPILEALVYAILNGEGMVKVVGEVGSGKTMLCRMLEKELPKHVEIVYLANPSLSPENILHAIAFELKLPVQATTSRLQVMQELQNYLLGRHAENRQVLVFVEEAQGMPIATLEQIRLLSNLETQQHKLLQLVLFGQPELDQRIARPEIRQLRERITYSFQLSPFAVDDIRDYLNSRMRACGFRGGEVFAPAAIRAIARYSGGLVRRVNILADKSLLAAYADNTHEVSKRHVHRAASDSEFVSNRRRFWLPAAFGVVVLVALLGSVYRAHVMGRGAAPADAKTALTAPATEPAAHREVPAVAAAHPAAEEAIPAPAAAAAPSVQTAGSLADVANPAQGVPGEGSVNAPADTAAAAAARADQASVVAESGRQTHPDAKSNEPPPRASGDRLLDISAVYGVQDLGDSRLSPEDSALMQKQLAAVPPEDVMPQGMSSAGDACKLCWSIVYRPLIKPENL